MPLSDYSQTAQTTTVTIANGASLSAAVDLYGSHLVAIAMPAAWTAADLTLQASADGSTFFNVYDGSSEVTVTAAASRFLVLDPAKLTGVRFLKVRSGTSSVAVAQAAERVLTLVVKA